MGNGVAPNPATTGAAPAAVDNAPPECAPNGGKSCRKPGTVGTSSDVNFPPNADRNASSIAFAAAGLPCALTTDNNTAACSVFASVTVTKFVVCAANAPAFAAYCPPAAPIWFKVAIALATKGVSADDANAPTAAGICPTASVTAPAVSVQFAAIADIDPTSLDANCPVTMSKLTGRPATAGDALKWFVVGLTTDAVITGATVLSHAFCAAEPINPNAAKLSPILVSNNSTDTNCDDNNSTTSPK
ncbi:hypothetical protein GCM10027157_14490 [Corynebacterium aquatimens]